MRPLTLLLVFLPLIVFSALARLLPSGLIGGAALAAAAVVLVTAPAIRPSWPPKVLSVVWLALFTLLAVFGFALDRRADAWLATWTGAGISLAVGLVILALAPVRPFTERFARETTPPAYWSSPTFRKVNRVLSLGWGVAIFAVGLSRVAAAAISQHTSRYLPELLLDLIAPVVIILGALTFSQSCYRSIQ
ncbi:MAG TPA: hypothetical protein VGI00_09350 [Streptosporangiaceae bacterium]|jgi:hypothetical protein